MMELEILNVSKEIYVCLYSIISLAAFSQSLPQLASQYKEQVIGLIKNIISIPGGLDESSLLYVGHWILSLVENKVLDNDNH